jgi:hypothetical protein
MMLEYNGCSEHAIMTGAVIAGEEECPFCRIERLQEGIKELGLHWSNNPLVKKLEAQVKELEKENAVLQRMSTRYGDELAKLNHEGHHSTSKMIDAAVHCANYHLKYGNNKGWWALNELHIFRCEGCRSCCPKFIDQGMQYIRNRPDCEGHGWVIGGEDE